MRFVETERQIALNVVKKMWPYAANKQHAIPFNGWRWGVLFFLFPVPCVLFDFSIYWTRCSRIRLCRAFVELKHAEWMKGNQTINQPTKRDSFWRNIFHFFIARAVWFVLTSKHSIRKRKKIIKWISSLSELKCPLLLLLWRSFKYKQVAS